MGSDVVGLCYNNSRPYVETVAKTAVATEALLMETATAATAGALRAKAAEAAAVTKAAGRGVSPRWVCRATIKHASHRMNTYPHCFPKML